MFWVTRIFDLLSATKKLNDSKTHVMSAVSNLMLATLMGLFGIILSALMIAGLLYLIYLQLVVAGVGVVVAMLCTAALTLVILGASGWAAAVLFGRVRSDVEQIFQSQAPIVAPVINKVGDVAGAFWSGLRKSRDKVEKSAKARSL